MPLIDQIGREVPFRGIPSRIVCLVPSLTELLVDLGLESSLVGVSKFCVHPAHIRKSKRVVGGTKKVNFGKVEDISPDFILCNKEENTPEIVNGLEAIAPVFVSDINSVEDCVALIETLGSIFKIEDSASKMTTQLLNKSREIESIARQLPKIKVIYLIWNEPLMAAGSGTFIDHMLGLVGLDNCVQQHRYPQLDPSDLEMADHILLSSEPFPFKEHHRKAIEKQTNVPTHLIDGEYCSWYGSRILSGLEYLYKFRKGLE